MSFRHHFPRLQQDASYRPTATGHAGIALNLNRRGLREQYAAAFRHILFKHCNIDTTTPVVEIDCKPFINDALILKVVPFKGEDGNIPDHEKWALAAQAFKKFSTTIGEKHGNSPPYEDFTVDQMNLRFHAGPMMVALERYTAEQGDELGISARHLYIIRSIQERIHILDKLSSPPQFSH